MSLFIALAVPEFRRIGFGKTPLIWLLLLASGLSAAAQQSLPGSGNALTFNDYSSYVACGSSNRGITREVTVEAWVKTTSSAYQWVAGKYLNSNFEEKDFHLYTTGGAAGFNGRNGSGDRT